MLTAIVAGCWELGWDTPMRELDLWEHPLRDFGVERFCMTPVSGIASLAVEEHADLGALLASERAAGRTIVFVDEAPEAEDLRGFVHPAQAVYVTGRTTFAPRLVYAEPGDRVVRVPTPGDGGRLWAHQAAAIVLYDRHVKQAGE